MKKATLQGFSAYTFYSDGTIKEGKKVVKTKDGKVTLVVSEDVPEASLIKGKKATYDVSALLTACDGGWVDIETAPPVNPENKEGESTTPPTTLTPEEQAKLAKREEIKKLKKALDQAKEDLITKGSAETYLGFKEAIDAAQKEYDEATKSVEPTLTDEQKVALEAYTNALSVVKEAKEHVVAASTLLQGLKEVAVTLGVKVTGETVEGRAAHVGYVNAQKIRADYAIGRFDGQDASKAMGVVDIAAKYGCSAQAVGYYANYLQHKLQRDNKEVIDGIEMNKAYTPLKNDYYNEHENSGFPNGAPYAEDGIKETNERYKLPKSRKGRAVVTETVAPVVPAVEPVAPVAQ